MELISIDFSMDEQKKGWISIIIPVYNAYANLDRCLESLARQSYRKLEIVFVNDCSTDCSLEKIEKWASSPSVSDLTVLVVSHKANSGVAVARNTGLLYARGEYIYYLDADDYIEPDTLEVLYQEAQSTSADIVGCEWFLSFNQNERAMQQAEVVDGMDLFIKMCYGVVRWNLWLFLVKREMYVAYGVHFMERQNMGEDMMVMLKLALHAGRVSIMHQPKYHYVQTNSSSLTKSWLEVCRQQVTANVNEVERYVDELWGTRLDEYLACLKQTVKLPLLVSGRREDYLVWLQWFPESNSFIGKNPAIAWRTRLLQYAASKRCFLFLKVYYLLVVKFIYGILYR